MFGNIPDILFLISSWIKYNIIVVKIKLSMFQSFEMYWDVFYSLLYDICALGKNAGSYAAGCGFLNYQLGPGCW